jgi:hypothetical protein
MSIENNTYSLLVLLLSLDIKLMTTYQKIPSSATCATRYFCILATDLQLITVAIS